MKVQEIYFAGGCFWGTEHFFKQVRGVVETQVGYANGSLDYAPSYKEVCTDQTGFAEAVRVCYDEEQVSLDFLIRMYFHAIDPTSLNRQGEDVGTQYRTGVYFTKSEQEIVAREIFKEVSAHLEKPLAVELLPLKNFYLAEDYHQDYLDNNPEGYCHLPLELFRWAREQ